MLIDRLNAFLWTCAIELPVYAWWLQGRFSRTSLLIALVIGLQLTTQPLLWHYTAHTAAAVPALLIAEGVVSDAVRVDRWHRQSCVVSDRRWTQSPRVWLESNRFPSTQFQDLPPCASRRSVTCVCLLP
jgi:hypothetical protein